jgi:hypothetical protein
LGIVQKQQVSSPGKIFWKESSCYLLSLLADHLSLLSYHIIPALSLFLWCSGKCDASSDPYWQLCFWLSLQRSLPGVDDQSTPLHLLPIVLSCLLCVSFSHSKPYLNLGCYPRHLGLLYTIHFFCQFSQLLGKFGVWLLLMGIHFPTSEPSMHCAVLWNVSCPLV